MSKNMERELKKKDKLSKKIEQFSDLLDNLQDTEDKKKLLWRDAYENALYDRENANILLTDLLLQVRGSVPLHTSLGSILSKYLERMSKSNDQILKLAELVSKEQERNEISSEDIFNEISKG